MNNKITFPELVEQVAQNANTSKRMSELFLKELFVTISQSLIDGESVKVKGIGTFKLTEVSPRKSVNVNTGEEIEIPGHKKLSFAPDKDLADAINQPFLHFETEILDDDVTDEQLAAIDAGEPVTPVDVAVPVAAEVPAEEPQVEAAEEPATEVEAKVEEEEVETPPAFAAPQEEPVVEEKPEAVAEPEEEVPVEVVEPESESEPEADIDPDPESVAEPEAEAVEGETEGAVSEEWFDERLDQEKDKRRITRRSLFEGFVVGVITTLIVSLFTYRLYLMKCPDQDKEPAKEEILAQATTADSVAEQPKTEPAKVDSAQLLAEQKAAEETKKAEEDAKKKAEVEKQQAAPKGVTASQDTVRIGTNLFKMSRKHYGSDKFWVYIYEENKAKYPNPNAIPVGAVLRIPPLSKYGAKAGDPASINTAKQKQAEIFNSINKKQ